MNVLETYCSCVQNQTEYGGEKTPGGGRKAELERDNYQIQFVVDGMENGLGHAGTHLLVNEFKMQNGQESVGLSAVCGMFKKLNPKVDEVGRRKQGRVSLGRSKIKLGDSYFFIWVKSSDNTPEYLQDLPSLSIQQIAFWDEVRKEQIVGFQGNKSNHFPCNANGRYNANGTIQSNAGSWLHMKYPEQAGLCMGIASVLLSNGMEEGQCCMPFDYTGKTVVAVAMYKRGRKMRSASKKTKGWLSHLGSKF